VDGVGGERGTGGAPIGAGLCDICRHQRVIRNTRGSVFSLCERSRSEPERFPRYPRLPVAECEGYEGRDGGGEGGGGGGEAAPT
jgi:hypothetical protein